MRAVEPLQSLESLLRGDPVEAMEIAKQIIGHKLVVDPQSLEAILLDKKSRKWTRIAAIYSLGFLGERLAIPALLSILSDRREPIGIRAHAAEALGNIGDAEAVPNLARVLKQEASPSLRQWCIYALEEIDTPEARAALRSARRPRRPSKRADR
jgi:HEAT repeat protein